MGGGGASPKGGSEQGSEHGSEYKKKKKKASLRKGEDDRDGEGRRILLSDCEVRGDAVVATKLTAFAKKAKKVQISATFQWFRVDVIEGSEIPIPGADKASYLLTDADAGFRLKVVGTPIVKDSGEVGSLVSAISDVVIWQEGAAPANPLPPQQQQPQQQQQGVGAEEPPEGPPVLTDWKIEMNPRQEYGDPITCHYKYEGGREGATVIEWYREVLEGPNAGSEEGAWELIENINGIKYQPNVDDHNKRIKIFITPVRADSTAGPTYQHILERLILPVHVSDNVARCMREVSQRGTSFICTSFDPRNQYAPTTSKRILLGDKQLKIKALEGEKTEVKTKIAPGCLQVKAWPQDVRCFELLIYQSKTVLQQKQFSFMCEDGHTRDIVVLVLRAISQ